MWRNPNYEKVIQHFVPQSSNESLNVGLHPIRSKSPR